MRRILFSLACLGSAVCAAGQQAQLPSPPASASVLRINAKEYGAQCNGKTDDTAAIQAALNVQSAYNITVLRGTNAEVELPPGTCILTAPLHIGLYGSLVGQNDGSTLYANYAAWHGKNYDAIDVSITGRVPSGESVAQRRIAHFRLFGGGNQGIPNSAGIHIHNTEATYDQQFQIPYLNIDDVSISGFDTGIEAEDWLSSSISNVNITAVRLGIWLNGHDVNIQIGHTNMAYSSFDTAHTSNHSATVALLLAPNEKFCTNCTNYPQGIDFHDSSVVAFDYDVWVSHAIAVD
ncbi:MAG: glycosyl hydrolase family 28-related protein, partial [Acidobacteriaceae bacterium]